MIEYPHTGTVGRGAITGAEPTSPRPAATREPDRRARRV